MTKFKVGDKVKRTGSFGHPFNDQKVYTVTFVSERYISVEDVPGEWLLDNFGLSTEWTIYNNTKPLRELTDEQLLLITKHKLYGGALERYDADDGWLQSNTVVIAANSKYRAKQKSERELFIEAALLATKPFSMDVEIVEAIAKDMFNAGFKAPEDKQC